ncbi:MAG TPA: branched-chain amino acid ABC transporter permease [Hyphomicrobiales bacterium]|nr:branched-chain amino acid ABC transporter permease [Hyphomicrobiales bacterium]
MMPAETEARLVSRRHAVAWPAIGAIAACVVLLGMPFVFSGFQLFQVSMTLVYAVALLGLNILTGYSGQISIAHGAFYALGAYTSAILMEHAGLPFYATIPVAALVCFVTGFLFGLPALRLEGLHLALATFALAVATPQLLKYKALEPWTGGVQGIFITQPVAPAGVPLSADQWTYFTCLVVCVIMFALGRNLVRGRIGRALIAIRDHSTAAAAMGVNLAFYKSVTFGISSLYAGVAGALSCIVVQFVAPDSFGMFVSIMFLVGIIIGGAASVSGAVFGAIAIEFLPNLTGAISKSAPWAVYGVVLILIIFLMPGGVAGAVSRQLRRLREPSGAS